MTHLERLQTTGIRRIGSPKSGFRYRSLNAETVTKADLKRIDELRIPPAWEEVAINHAATGRVQVVGRDAAGRWQYLYHANHTRKQELKKFRRILKFAEALPKLRSAISRDLKQTGLGRDRVLATMLRILSTCFMRAGSDVYASENGSYGIATLRRQHVKVKGETVSFDFPGKSGVRQQREISDRRVAKVIRALLNQPGRRVFRYQNGDGQFVDVTTRQINQYIKEVMGEKFSAKDFRTWAGTLICACALARCGCDEEDSKTSRKRKMVAAIKETAEALGNTAAVCKGSYISPTVLNEFEKGKIVDNYFPSLQAFLKFRGRTLHSAERSLLKFMKRSATS